MIFRTKGINFDGFDEMRVFQSMETLSDGFSFKSKIVPKEIKAGESVEVLIDGVKRITGFYDQWKGRRSSNVEITGKDKPGRLIRTYPKDFTGEFVQQTPKQIITALVAPFGITVDGLDGDLIKRYNFRFDKTNARIIQDICTRAGILASSDPDGNIVLTDSRKAVRSNLSFVEGQNIHDLAIDIDLDLRHSEYNIYAQSRFSAFLGSEKVLQSAPGLSKNFAPFNKIQGAQYEIADAKREALWQQQYNDGSSVIYTIFFAGMLDAQVNTLATVASEYLGVGGDLLIRDLEFISKPGDTMTILTLVSPLTYGGIHTVSSHVLYRRTC